MQAIFYQVANCDTCRKAAKFLKSSGVSVDTREIVATPPSEKELVRMAGYVGGIRKLFNTSGVVYREMDLSKKLPTMSDEAAIRLLAGNGKLVKRPFLIWETGGLVGFQEAIWKKELGK